MSQITLNITAHVKNAIEQKELERTLTNLANLDSENRSKIAKIIASPQAVKALSSKWILIKTYLNI
jgi:intracellular sulfur oxidation DsrE/DsrF family protein